MSRELLNTLFVMTQGAYVRLEGETAKVEVEGKTMLQTPLHHLGGIVTFGSVMMSPHLMHKCASEGRGITFLTMNGRFQARVVGPVSGNVLLREAQYRTYSDDQAKAAIARSIVAGKIQNMRAVLLRTARETENEEKKTDMGNAAERMSDYLAKLRDTLSVNEAMGYEGQATADYFAVFDHMILSQRGDFKFGMRSRRPPRDRMNALLSFLYALVLGDCTAAAEGVGLDPQLGFLHALRSGKPALSLDLMEEFRPVLADRLALTLVNRREIRAEHLDVRTGGSVRLTDDGRKILLAAYQKRKQREVHHSLLKTKTPIGLLPHLQARILARHLRGDMREYYPYYPR